MALREREGTDSIAGRCSSEWKKRGGEGFVSLDTFCCWGLCHIVACIIIIIIIIIAVVVDGLDICYMVLLEMPW